MPRFLSICKVSLACCAPHHHSTWEIGIYIAGVGRAWVETDEHPFERGTIICYPPVFRHKEATTVPYTGYFIETDVLRLGSERTPIFRDTSSGTIERLAGLLHDEFHLKEPGWQTATQDLFDLIVDYLQRWRQGGSSHPLVEDLKHLLIGNLQNPQFQIGEALKSLPMSPDHLRETFEKVTGRTPLRYLTELRVSEARNLLKQGYSVKETGVRVGYPDPYYFSRIFHKTTGLRPSTYAQKEA